MWGMEEINLMYEITKYLSANYQAAFKTVWFENYDCQAHYYIYLPKNLRLVGIYDEILYIYEVGGLKEVFRALDNVIIEFQNYFKDF